MAPSGDANLVADFDFSETDDTRMGGAGGVVPFLPLLALPLPLSPLSLNNLNLSNMDLSLEAAPAGSEVEWTPLALLLRPSSDDVPLVGLVTRGLEFLSAVAALAARGCPRLRLARGILRGLGDPDLDGIPESRLDSFLLCLPRLPGNKQKITYYKSTYFSLKYQYVLSQASCDSEEDLFELLRT